MRKARGRHGHPEARGIHHGTMVARAGRADPCEAPGRVARWHAPDLMSSFRSSGIAGRAGPFGVRQFSGWGRGFGAKREGFVFPVFAWFLSGEVRMAEVVGELEALLG